MRSAYGLIVLLGCTPPTTVSSPGRTPDPPPAPAPPETARVPAPAPSTYAPPVAPHLPLHVAHPELELPVAPLGRWPTPVTSHPELAEALGLGALWLVRDDASAEPYGGGKPRKLELLLGAAVAEGRDTVITFGGVGSHHALATALYGPRVGLKVVLMLLPQPRSPEVREVLLASHRAGAELVMAGSMTRARALAEARRRARPDAVAILAPGGSEPRGNAGFVSAGFELAQHLEAGDLPSPDAVVLALGTMGSAVGLDIGLVAAGRPLPIVAVRASSVPISTPKKLRRMHEETVRWLRRRSSRFPSVPYDAERLSIEGGFLGEGYAQPTAAGRDAMAVAAAHGIALEGTYTAKAFAALRALAKGPLAGRTVLFWLSHHGAPLTVDDIDPRSLPPAFRSWVIR